MRDINIFLILHSAKNQVKYVVFEEALLYLFACPSYHLSTPTITKHECGTFIRVTQTCEHCEAVNIWDSQPFINSHNIGCASISTKMFYEHQQKNLLPAIFRTWGQQQEGLISILLFDNIPLVLRGDDRAGSPGHCANLLLT